PSAPVVPDPVGCLPLTGPLQVIVPVSPLVVRVPELGDVVSPGEATTSNSKVHGVPDAPLAWPAGSAPASRNATPINKKLRLPIGPPLISVVCVCGFTYWCSCEQHRWGWSRPAHGRL